jgi:hypothetical protein
MQTLIGWPPRRRHGGPATLKRPFSPPTRPPASRQVPHGPPEVVRAVGLTGLGSTSQSGRRAGQRISSCAAACRVLTMVKKDSCVRFAAHQLLGQPLSCRCRQGRGSRTRASCRRCCYWVCGASIGIEVYFASFAARRFLCHPNSFLERPGTRIMNVHRSRLRCCYGV